MQYWKASTLLQIPEEQRQIVYDSGVYMVNDCFLPLYEQKAFRKQMWGARGSGKSHHATDYADWILTTKDYARVLFLRYVKEDVRSSLWQSFKDGLEAKGRLNEYNLVENTMTAKHRGTCNILTCKGVKASKTQTAKLKSIAGYTHIIIEEADEMPKEDKRKLMDSVRKKGVELEIIEMWNTANKLHHIYEDYDMVPSGKDGYYMAVPKKDSGVISMHSTYIDNIHNLNDEFIRRYKAAEHGTDINYYLSDVKGFIPSFSTNMVLPHFKKIEIMPPCDRYIWGIDYGYNSDQTALVKVGVKGRQRYFQQICYEPGISASQINTYLQKNGRKPTETLYSEHDKEMILQLRKLGVSITMARKGPNSKIAGVAKTKEYECFYIGADYENEIVNWQYITVTDLLTGKTVVTNEPKDGNDHLCQAGIYAVYTDSFIHRAGY